MTTNKEMENKPEELANQELNEALGTNGVNYFLPSNFVKLFELNKPETLADEIDRVGRESASGSFTNREIFIQKSIEYIKDKRLLYGYFKQQARQTEWEH